MQSRFSDVCSLLLAAPLLSQDRWDGFNLIIAADVASEYFLKHLLSHEKLSEQSFFSTPAYFTLCCTVFLCSTPRLGA